MASIEREEVAEEDPPGAPDDGAKARTLVRAKDVEPGPGESRIVTLCLSIWRTKDPVNRFRHTDPVDRRGNFGTP